MPSRNIIKEFAPDQYYHVYNRGVEKRIIFVDDQDYTVFIGLMKKYLVGSDKLRGRHTQKPIGEEVKLLSYCLMPNHFHLLLYQTSESGVTKFMRKLATGYAMYFNDRYNRVGTLFQGRYKASHIDEDAYIQHISRYIHMNPDGYSDYPYSSYKYFMSPDKTPNWLRADLLISFFDNDYKEYQAFITDYEETAKELDLIKWQLANNID